MKRFLNYIVVTLARGLLIVVPLYLALLLLLKAMNSLMGLVRPVAKLLPNWFPGERILCLLLLAIVCLLVGACVRSPRGRATWDRIEKSLFARIPGYALFRGLTQQVAGESQDSTWRPALAEIEEALVPAFIIEEFEDGRFTVFVPSVPTPLAGAIYVLSPERVHPLNIPFTHALRAFSHWGLGCRELVTAMEGHRAVTRSQPWLAG